MNVGQIVLILIAFLFFVFGACWSQVEVLHFNSEWNVENNFDISNLKDCETENIIICHNPEMQEKHSILSVPTIIIFDEGEEVKRFQANIMLQIDATRKQIQREIDEIYLKKFE